MFLYVMTCSYGQWCVRWEPVIGNLYTTLKEAMRVNGENSCKQFPCWPRKSLIYYIALPL